MLWLWDSAHPSYPLAWKLKVNEKICQTFIWFACILPIALCLSDSAHPSIYQHVTSYHWYVSFMGKSLSFNQEVTNALCMYCNSFCKHRYDAFNCSSCCQPKRTHNKQQLSLFHICVLQGETIRGRNKLRLDIDRVLAMYMYKCTYLYVWDFGIWDQFMFAECWYLSLGRSTYKNRLRTAIVFKFANARLLWFSSFNHLNASLGYNCDDQVINYLSNNHWCTT